MKVFFKKGTEVEYLVLPDNETEIIRTISKNEFDRFFRSIQNKGEIGDLLRMFG
jgi:hypothetical protein